MSNTATRQYVLAKTSSTNKKDKEKGVTKRDVNPDKAVRLYESSQLHPEAVRANKDARDKQRGALLTRGVSRLSHF